jgi:GTP-binding protein
MVNGRRIKLRYAHLGGANPPLIVIHGNQTEKVPKSYSRYLENTYRRVLKLVGTPIRIEYKGGENPYEGNKNTLTDRQVNKKRRLMSHHKKAEKKRRDKRAIPRQAANGFARPFFLQPCFNLFPDCLIRYARAPPRAG